MEQTRLNLRKRVSPDRVKELLGGIGHRRFRPLQKELIKDLEADGFGSIALELYLRLAGWSHTGGTYVNASAEVRALCRELFGYELPARIGTVALKDFRYRTGAGLEKIALEVFRYHARHLARD